MADFAKQCDANVANDPAQTAATLSLAAKCLGINGGFLYKNKGGGYI
jgi:hypothetical protein